MHKKSAGMALLAGLIIMQILPCNVKGMFLHEAPKLPAISMEEVPGAGDFFSEETQNVETYLRRSASEVKQAFPDFLEKEMQDMTPATALVLPDLIFRYTHTEDQMICTVSLRTSGSGYTLFGLEPSMSMEEIDGMLESQGFVKKDTSSYADRVIWFSGSEKCWLEVGPSENGVTVLTAKVCRSGPHPEKTEIQDLMGGTKEEAMARIADLEEEVIQDVSSSVNSEKTAVMLKGKNVRLFLNGEGRIFRITLIGDDPAYSFYGFCPGDDPYEAAGLGLPEGGSGEWVDPAGNVLYMYESLNPEMPSLGLSNYQLMDLL